MKNYKPHFKVGDQIGRLTIKEINLRIDGRLAVLCDCSCGKEIFTRESHIKIGRVSSCGCFKKDYLSKKSKTHGLSHTPEHKTWLAIHQRCNNPNNPDYHNYGGRGLKVSEKWDKFEDFLRDMGIRPTDRHSIERKNNELGYSPENCIWATSKEQSRNKRSNRFVTAMGKTQTIVEWSEEIGISFQLISKRLQRGWSEEKSITTPIRIWPKKGK